MLRHKAHVSVALAKIAEKREESIGESVLARLENLYRRGERVLDEAERSGDGRLALQAIRETREVLAGVFTLANKAAERGGGGGSGTLIVEVVHIGAVAVTSGEKIRYFAGDFLGVLPLDEHFKLLRRSETGSRNVGAFVEQSYTLDCSDSYARGRSFDRESRVVASSGSRQDWKNRCLPADPSPKGERRRIVSAGRAPHVDSSIQRAARVAWPASASELAQDASRRGEKDGLRASTPETWCTIWCIPTSRSVAIPHRASQSPTALARINSGP